MNYSHREYGEKRTKKTTIFPRKQTLNFLVLRKTKDSTFDDIIQEIKKWNDEN